MPSEYPAPSVNSSYPVPLFYEMQAEEFVVSRTIYDDNGADYKLQAGGAGKKTWMLRYDGLAAAQAAILDSWVATMFYSEENGSAYGANFREHVLGDAPWTSVAGTLHSNVHIAPGGYKKSHVKSSICAREFILEKRP